MRFDRRMRLFGSTMFAIGVIVWLPIAIYVPALTFNQVTGINIHVITPVVCAVCTFYTCVGGLKAVVYTDVVQSFIMYGSIILVIVKGSYDVGGFGTVWQRNLEGGRLVFPELTLDPTVRLSFLAVFIGGTFHKLQSTAVNQIIIQRFMALPSKEHAKRSLIVFSIGLIILLLLCVFVGLVTYAVYQDCDPLTTKLAKATDQLVPLLVMDILGVFPGLPGLFVAGVFSAALSSLSTGLNSLAAVILEDFIKPYRTLTEKQTHFWLRFIVFFFGISCVGLVFVVEKLGMVLQLATTLGAVTQGPVVGIFVIGICIPWINAKSTFVGSGIAFSILSYTCIRAQVAQILKEIIYAKKPVSVEACTYLWDNSTYLEDLASAPGPTAGTSLHHMSFLWYSAFGATLTIIGSLLASMHFGFNDTSEIDPELIMPYMRKFLKRKQYETVKMSDLKP